MQVSAVIQFVALQVLAVGQLDVQIAGVRLVPGVNGWLPFRAWSCSSASPIGSVSS
jgi:hypothetical protein